MTGSSKDQTPASAVAGQAYNLPPPLKVLYFGTYRSNYSRNQIMINGLRLNGVIVIEAHAQLWRGIGDRVNLASGGWSSPKFWWRLFKAYARLLIAFAKARDYDVIVIGYPGQFDIFLAYVLRYFHRKPICWDILMSIYLVAVERKLDQKSTFTVNWIKRIEGKACHLADMMVLESDEYVKWFNDTYSADPERFWLVPLGADENRIHPFEVIKYTSQDQDEFRVVYWGTFIRNHGVEVMLEAASLLKDQEGIIFEFVGVGPERDRMVALAEQQQLENIIFPGWVEDDLLMEKIASAHLCLGVFGTTQQSLMTMQNKIFECLAMRKPLITGISPVMSRNFIHKKHLYFCERNPKSLADSIWVLKNDPDILSTIAVEGYRLYRENFSNREIGSKFLKGLEHLVAG